jgi:hypothetical protein
MDLSEIKRTIDQYYILIINKLIFSEFYYQFQLLIIIIRITNQITLYHDLISKITDFYYYILDINRIANSNFLEDIKVY